MTDYMSKDTFLGMIQIMQADVVKLSDIADEFAIAKAQDIVRSGGGYQQNTSSPIGENLAHAGEVDSYLTAPLAMTCFSIVDVIGKILYKTDLRTIKYYDEIRDPFINHARAFEGFIDRDYLKNCKTAQRLQDCFRHSMAHCFLPIATHKTSYYITMHFNFKEEPLLIDWKDGYILNVRCLSSITKSVLAKLVTMAESKDSEDILIIDKIVDSYELFLEEAISKIKHVD